MIAIIGTPTAHQARKSADLPSTSGRFRNPIATTFVAVPIGVAIPPTLAPNAVISSRAEANRECANPPGSPRPAASTVTIPTTTGHIIAAAAVLLIHIEMNVTDPPTAASSVPGLRPAHRV